MGFFKLGEKDLTNALSQAKTIAKDSIFRTWGVGYMNVHLQAKAFC